MVVDAVLRNRSLSKFIRLGLKTRNSLLFSCYQGIRCGLTVIGVQSSERPATQ